MKAEEIMLSEGILCSSVRVPAVAPEKSILRITINATHTQEHISKLLSGLEKVATLNDLPLNPYNSDDWDHFRNKHWPKYIPVVSKTNEEKVAS